MKTRVLILCTGNSCRSQMAEGFLRKYAPDWDIHSAGTEPSDRVHPRAVAVMKEVDVDISKAVPKRVDSFLTQSFDYVITVCGHAQETCPRFSGSVKKQLHIGFEDPALAHGTDEEIGSVFRTVRDQIGVAFRKFYEETKAV